MTIHPPFHRPAPFPRPVVRRPLCATMICAGFPSPADDHQERTIDLNEELIGNEAATFFYRVIGESGHSSLTRDGFVRNGDIAVVDRSVTPAHGNLVLAVVDGELCFKKLRMVKRRVWLESSNEAYPMIEITGECTLVIEGVVRWTIHKQ